MREVVLVLVVYVWVGSWLLGCDCDVSWLWLVVISWVGGLGWLRSVGLLFNCVVLAFLDLGCLLVEWLQFCWVLWFDCIGLLVVIRLL